MTVFSYDDVNRVTSMLRATGFNGSGGTGLTWTYTYSATSATAAGTTTAKDPELHAIAYKHDGDGQVTDVTDALQRKRSTKFDANHNIDTATDAMGSGTTPGNVTDYGFNSRNNLETAKTPTGALTTNHWQTIAGGDHPSDSTNADGEKTTFGYDSVGNTTSVAQTGTGGGNVTYDYNPATPTCGGFEGQRCSAKTKMTSSKTVTTAFHYDAQGNLDRVTPPAPLDKATYTYDALGRTKTVTDARGVTATYSPRPAAMLRRWFADRYTSQRCSAIAAASSRCRTSGYAGRSGSSSRDFPQNISSGTFLEPMPAPSPRGFSTALSVRQIQALRTDNAPSL